MEAQENEMSPLEKLHAKYADMANSTDQRAAEKAREMLVILDAIDAPDGVRASALENAISILSVRVGAIEDAARTTGKAE